MKIPGWAGTIAFTAALVSPLAAQTVGSSTSAQGRAVSPPSVRPPITRLDLVGRPFLRFPYFESVRTLDQGATSWIAIDPTRYTSIAGAVGDVYVVAEKSDSQWAADASLVDVRGAPQTIAFVGTDIQTNTFMLDPGTLNGDAGTSFGIGYDVVIDVDQDGKLGPGDFIDGLGPEAGFYVVKDPAQPGPLAVTRIQYSGGSFLGQDLFYPSNIASLGSLPLVVVSHGNGHQYTWYDHIGNHLASWGFIVMSHQNNTMPGPEAASVTTLSNTEYILSHLDTIAGGALQGHLDGHRILWIGHSRGGEGVVRAYNKIRLGTYSPQYFSAPDVQMVSSIAPTEFLTSTQLNPFDVNYHMFVGASDSDVTGDPSNTIVQSIPIFERSTGTKHLMIVQGAGHADFHNGGGFCWCTGPSLIGAAATHLVELGYYLPLAKLYTEGNVPARDYFERMYDDFHAPTIPSNVIVATEYHESAAMGNFVVDDFQTQPSTTVSSCGQNVAANVLNLVEGQMTDLDSSFVFSALVPLNGMTRRLDAGDNPRCAVFDWNASASAAYQFDLPATPIRDFSAQAALSFRASQGTRHPETDTLDSPLSFGVQLVDELGAVSTIDFGQFGRVTRTYKRTGFGAGAGWANEFSTVRLRLEDFTHNTPGFDLKRVQAVRLVFGGGIGSNRGRVGLDDLEIIRKGN